MYYIGKMKEDVKTKKRDMNFELLRIIAMFLIICSHYNGSGGFIVTHATNNIFNYYFLEYMTALILISVNLYVLITGYYMINSKMKLNKLFNLWFVVFFYSVTMLLVSFLVGGVKPTIKDLIRAMLPIITGRYWFATIYIALYVLTPFLNKLLKSLTKKQYQVLICILFFMFVVISTISNGNGLLDSNQGRSLIFFVYLYMVGGYIRLHYNRKTNRKLCLFLTFAIPALTVIIKVLAKKILNTNFEQLDFSFSNILVFINTLCAFLYFKDLKIESKILNKIIATLAPLTFGIYLIHTSPYFYKYIWYNIFDVLGHANSNYLVLHYFGTVLIVFFACGFIEFMRVKLLERNKSESFIDKKINNLNNKIGKIMEEE